ncbi:MAG TPA: iron export ABC transporter permease subunit FetB [Leptolyngbyaceae cyanobacterium M33_DOE_097]|uniref:Iron export ABC transporter permease subunit FetB n=1 Tax=Oscillatoriales cyanobacterium SpSt-418 TaxID=2282169 RepID=A0A7C3KI48_9CYAN|nr:iron export ABC transporter permease subunit FetB [Leptolyngbyaceae cyanobacterium M33_DOE_097]
MDSYIQLIWAVGFMAIAIALSAWQRLELEGNLTLATGRTVLQLLVVGYVLATVFALRSPLVVLMLLGVMLLTAAIVARNRISKKIPNLLPLVAGAIFLGSTVTLLYTIVLVVRPDNWYEPRFLIPFAGIVLGNSMNAAAIAGERLVSTLNSSRLEIETHLSLGAAPTQAVARYRRDAIKAGMISIINSMMVVGLVTLPGVMVGQLLGGAEPLQAAAYQILIMFMLAFADLVTTLLVTTGICRQYFNSAAQLVL